MTSNVTYTVFALDPSIVYSIIVFWVGMVGAVGMISASDHKEFPSSILAMSGLEFAGS